MPKMSKVTISLLFGGQLSRISYAIKIRQSLQGHITIFELRFTYKHMSHGIEITLNLIKSKVDAFENWSLE